MLLISFPISFSISFLFRFHFRLCLLFNFVFIFISILVPIFLFDYVFDFIYDSFVIRTCPMNDLFVTIRDHSLFTTGMGGTLAGVKVEASIFDINKHGGIHFPQISQIVASSMSGSIKIWHRDENGFDHDFNMKQNGHVYTLLFGK